MSGVQQRTPESLWQPVVTSEGRGMGGINGVYAVTAFNVSIAAMWCVMSAGITNWPWPPSFMHTPCHCMLSYARPG